MQNFKDIMLKNLCSAVIFFTYLLVMPSVWMAEGADVKPQIFIGNTPAAITVQRGMPVKVPIFFVGGTYANKAVELFIYRADTEGNVVCFGPDGWESDYVTALEDFKPLGSVGMPEYVYVDWPAVDNSQSLLDCSLCVCVDDQIDGIFTASSYCCGCQSIIIEEVDDDTGDGDGGDDTGDGGVFPTPTVPPFFDLGGDSGGPCDSLSPSYISRSLELGESEQITLSVLACGSSATVSKANNIDPNNDPWLSVSVSGGKLILGLDATGLKSRQDYRGGVSVTATAGGISIADDISVTLSVLGQCDPASALVDPKSLTFQAYVGGQDPSAQTLRVKDDCGDAVSATVVSKPDFVTLTPTTSSSTGVFSVSCVESYLEEEGSYSGSIIFEDGDYDQQHSVSVKLEVTTADTPDDSVTTVQSGHLASYDVGAGQTKYFKFSMPTTTECTQGFQVSNTPMADQPRTVHALVKRGSKPTEDDFNRTLAMQISSHYDCGLGQWMPAKPGAENLYWNYNTGSQAEFIEMNEPMESNTFYIMLYNNGTTTVRDQYLTLKIWD